MANPTGGGQENFVPGSTQQQTIPLPTQSATAPQQRTNNTNGTTTNTMHQQSQDNAVNNSQPQITQNPMGGIQ